MLDILVSKQESSSSSPQPATHSQSSEEFIYCVLCDLQSAFLSPPLSIFDWLMMFCLVSSKIVLRIVCCRYSSQLVPAMGHRVFMIEASVIRDNFLSLTSALCTSVKCCPLFLVIGPGVSLPSSSPSTLNCCRLLDYLCYRPVI